MPNQPTPAEIVDRAADLRAGDSQFRTLWQEISDFCLPRMSEILTKRGKGARRTSPLLYDSTAEHSVLSLAGFINSSITPATSQWIDMEHSIPELNEDEESRDWLLMVIAKVHKRFQQSNFDSEIKGVYTQLAGLATGTLFVDALLRPRTPRNPTGFGGFRFKSIPLGSYSIAEDQHGLVDSLFREMEPTARTAIEMFGAEAVPPKVRTGKPAAAVQLLHAVFPREGVPREAPMGTAAKRLPFASYWIDVESKTLLEESGYHEFPYGVVRWDKQAPEVWGRGQGEVALPDIRTLNEAVMLRLQAWGSAVRPPLEALDKGVIGRPSTKPNAVNYVKAMGNLKPLDLGARFDVANFQEAQYRDAIKQYFFIDKLTIPDKVMFTATEVNSRVLSADRILGPALGRMDSDLLRRIVQRSFKLMLRAGEFDPIPELVLAAYQDSSSGIEINFIGPLAKAQKARELDQMGQFVQSVFPLAQAQPEVLDKIDFDAYVDMAAEATAMKKLLRSDRKVKDIRAARAEQQAAAAKQAQMLEMMSAMGQAAPAIAEDRAARAEQRGAA